VERAASEAAEVVATRRVAVVAKGGRRKYMLGEELASASDSIRRVGQQSLLSDVVVLPIRQVVSHDLTGHGCRLRALQSMPLHDTSEWHM
jgi:hypothetical protein